jgi:hypothetical protein
VWGKNRDCSNNGNNLLHCSLHCLFCSNSRKGRSGIAKSEKVTQQRRYGKEKPPEGGFYPK